MTEPVKRYYIMESAVGPMLDKQMTYTPLFNYKTDVHVVPLVMAADYARLEQECERLLDLLADWSSHFTGPKVIGGPLSSLRERTDAALLNGGRSCT